MAEKENLHRQPMSVPGHLRRFCHVRYRSDLPPVADIKTAHSTCPFRAIRGLMHRSKQQYQSPFHPATLAATMAVKRRGGVIYVGVSRRRMASRRSALSLGTGWATRQVRPAVSRSVRVDASPLRVPNRALAKIDRRSEAQILWREHGPTWR